MRLPANAAALCTTEEARRIGIQGREATVGEPEQPEIVLRKRPRLVCLEGGHRTSRHEPACRCSRVGRSHADKAEATRATGQQQQTNAEPPGAVSEAAWSPR